MNILFHSNKDFFSFTDVYEYATILAKNPDNCIHFLGFAEHQSQFVHEGVKVHHILADRLDSYLLSLMTYRFDIIHVFHYRGCWRLRKIIGWDTKMILDVRTIHVESKGGSYSTPIIGMLKDRITWIESLFYNYKLALTSTIKKSLLPSIRKVNIIPLGVSKSKFFNLKTNEKYINTRSSLGIDEKVKVLFYSGSLSPSRSMHTLFQAVANVMRVKMNVAFVVVGFCSFPEYEQSLLDIFKSSDIESRFFFIGKVPYNEVLQYYSIADIGFSYTPSQTRYALQPPTKLLEYMMAGITCFSNITKATANMINNYETGYLCGQTENELEIGILAAIENDNSRIIENALRYVEEFSWEKIVKDFLIEYYNSTLK